MLVTQAVEGKKVLKVGLSGRSKSFEGEHAGCGVFHEQLEDHGPSAKHRSAQVDDHAIA